LPLPTETTEAKLNSHQMQEQTDITSTDNGDAAPIMKPEPVRVPSSNRNRNNHPCKPSDFDTNDNSMFVCDPGGNHLDTKDDPTRVDDNDSPASSISNEPCTADA